MAITFLVHVVTCSFFQLCLVDMVRYRKNNIRINFERGPNMAQIIPGSLSVRQSNMPSFTSGTCFYFI